jgi:hypothetical protein
MKTKGFLIVGKNGSLRAVKSMRSDLGPDEIAVALDVVIPDTAFKPTITAEIKIDEKDVTPLLIKAGKLNAISERLTNELGLKVVLKTVDREDTDNGE